MTYKYVLLLGFVASMGANSLSTISQAGNYKAGSNVLGNPSADNEYIIEITSSNVTLDLNNNTVSQDSNNIRNGITGIYINPNLNNVTIKNGLMQDINGNAIVVDQGCNEIRIENIEVQRCDGLEFNGTSGAPIIQSRIKDCEISASNNNANGEVILLSNCTDLRVKQCNVSNNGNSAYDIIGIKCINPIICHFDQIQIINNTGSSFIGLALDSPDRCTFNHCSINNNNALGINKNVLGIDISGAGNNKNYFANCLVLENSSAGSAVGFSIGDNSTNNTFINCSAIGQLGQAAIGFSLFGTGLNSQHNFFIECLAKHNQALGSGDYSEGFLIDGSHSGTLSHCRSSNNNSANSRAIGLSFRNAGGSYWNIEDCVFERNTGSSNANSYGIYRLVGIGNLFTKNIAFNNGTLRFNQLRGVPGASLSSANSSNVNTLRRPWTNLAIIP